MLQSNCFCQLHGRPTFPPCISVGEVCRSPGPGKRSVWWTWVGEGHRHDHSLDLDWTGWTAASQCGGTHSEGVLYIGYSRGKMWRFSWCLSMAMTDLRSFLYVPFSILSPARGCKFDYLGLLVSLQFHGFNFVSPGPNEEIALLLFLHETQKSVFSSRSPESPVWELSVMPSSWVLPLSLGDWANVWMRIPVPKVLAL